MSNILIPQNMACQVSLDRKDWRRDWSTLSEHLWHMYQNHLCIDLIIGVFSDCKHRMFKCHKIVMRRLTPIFDSPKDGPVQLVQLQCVTTGSLDPDMFSAIIQFAYTDRLQVESMTELIAIQKLATLCQMDQIKKECNKLFVSHTNTNSIWELIEYISTEPDLAQSATTFLAKSTNACLKSPSFLNCSQEVLKFVLDQEQLNVTEMQLINAVIQWAKHKNLGADLNPERSRQLLGPCLSQIRFLCLTASEFSDKIILSGLLSKEHCLYILMMLTGQKKLAYLPDYVCKLETPRIRSQGGYIGQVVAKKDRPENPIAKYQSANKLNGASGAVEAKKMDEQLKEKWSAHEPDDFLVLREIDSKFRLTTFSLKTPGESNVEIEVSKPVFLSGVLLATQMKNVEIDKTYNLMYKENMYIRLFEMDASNNNTPKDYHEMDASNKKRQKYYHTYSRYAMYGPDHHFAVMFKTLQKLKPNVPYLIQLTFLRKPGEYRFHKRENLVFDYQEDVVVKFRPNVFDTCAADPLAGIFLEKTATM